MSRQGNKPIELPKNVQVQMEEGNVVFIKGPKGSLKQKMTPGVKILIEENVLKVQKDASLEQNGALHGLYRALIGNMIKGVSEGYEKKLQLIGTGYRAQLQGDKLDVKVGYSHPTIMEVPKELTVSIDKQGVNISITGYDKQMVGQFAAQVRALRPPEPYKGKGIRYKDEYVRKKAGKAAKSK
jgi:large subunit ribosomal protein L6